MPIVNMEEMVVEKKLDQKVRLPKERYQVRIKEETFGISKSSGNPMITWELEVAGPDSVEDGLGGKLIVAGAKLKPQYWPMQSKDKETGLVDAEKTKASLGRFKEAAKKLGIDIDWTTFNTDNPPLKAKGIIADCICSSEESQQRKAPKAGQQVGDPIMGADNKPIIRYEHKVDMFLGVGQLGTNVAY